jgi:hypothetical protein
MLELILGATLPESSAGWQYWRGSLVDGVDDLAAVDPFEVNAGDAEVRVSKLALDDDEWHALAGHLNRVGVSKLVRCEATPNARGHCEVTQSRPGGGCRPGTAGRRSTHYAKQRADGHRQADLQPLAEVLPSPGIHADLATSAALPAPDQNAPAGRVQVALGKRQRLIDSQSCAPKQHDQRSSPQSRCAIAGGTHNGDDLLDGRRVGRVAPALVAWRAAAMKAGHGRRRPAATSGIEKKL